MHHRKFPLTGSSARLVVLSSIGVTGSLAPAGVTFDIDYSLDSNGFFSSSTANGLAARAAMAAAADVYADRLLDNLSAIVPTGQNSWTPVIFHPATGAQFDITGNPTIAAGTIKVYAGGRDLPGSTLGSGGPGGWGASGFPPFFDTLSGRGQAGALLASPTDFGPWGGSISMDSATTWSYSVANNPGGGQSDFFSVALHELGHLLGIGTADSFTATFSSGLSFTGAKAVALNGGAAVPLANAGHLSGSITSTVTGADSQQPAMSPSITVGTRKRYTLMDWAVLDDLGWDLARPGDANADAAVNFDDLLVLAQNYNGSGKTWSEGDFNYTGTVNFDDLLILAQAYGTSGPLLSDVALARSEAFAADWATAWSMVPEPACLTGMILLLRRRRTA